LRLNQNSAPGEPDSSAPASSVFSGTQNKMAQQNTNVNSQLVKVPIDEKEAIGLTVSPTYHLDDVMSVTLKAFRKVIGYDTFDSIRKGARSEQKDTNDYYNVTVSMMVQRVPLEVAPAPPRDPYAPDGAPSLAASLDKGFPYDD